MTRDKIISLATVAGVRAVNIGGLSLGEALARELGTLPEAGSVSINGVVFLDDLNGYTPDAGSLIQVASAEMVKEGVSGA